MRRLITYDHYDGSTACHLGAEKTTKRIQRMYWWPMMVRDIKVWTHSCESCQRAGKFASQQIGLLHPLEPVLRPFERMGMDVVTIIRKAIVLGMMDHGKL
jgi:hypothetical protein